MGLVSTCKENEDFDDAVAIVEEGRKIKESLDCKPAEITKMRVYCNDVLTAIHNALVKAFDVLEECPEILETCSSSMFHERREFEIGAPYSAKFTYYPPVEDNRPALAGEFVRNWDPVHFTDPDQFGLTLHPINSGLKMYAMSIASVEEAIENNKTINLGFLEWVDRTKIAQIFSQVPAILQTAVVLSARRFRMVQNDRLKDGIDMSNQEYKPIKIQT